MPELTFTMTAESIDAAALLVAAVSAGLSRWREAPEAKR
jgi:hypothetical protein